MYSGIEVDVLSLGDADCIVVTQWAYSTQWRCSFPHRVLIDGGAGADAEYAIDFFRSRGYTNFWAAVCTHPHNDHARGLIKVVQNKSITIHKGWMHDIRKHVGADALHRASAADDGVREVVETTKELASAFASRNITPQEPFAGSSIAFWPGMTVLGPSLPFYRRVVEEFTKVEVLPAVAVPPP
jgi:glyoxylase-like metal-dependent hydrolase (beta-lactamase superfamily II)